MSQAQCLQKSSFYWYDISRSMTDELNAFTWLQASSTCKPGAQNLVGRPSHHFVEHKVIHPVHGEYPHLQDFT